MLDLGCGYGEFSNNIAAGKKFAMDLNPSAQSYLAPRFSFCSRTAAYPGRFPTSRSTSSSPATSSSTCARRPALQSTVGEAFRCLKPGGLFIALGPNIKFLAGEYWDFFDHYLALTELSLAEALTMMGFRSRRRFPSSSPTRCRRVRNLRSGCFVSI